MPPALRRSRSRFDSDDDLEISREATPLSTAPNDAKRARRSLLAHEDDEDDEDEDEDDEPKKKKKKSKKDEDDEEDEEDPKSDDEI